MDPQISRLARCEAAWRTWLASVREERVLPRYVPELLDLAGMPVNLQMYCDVLDELQARGYYVEFDESCHWAEQDQSAPRTPHTLHAPHNDDTSVGDGLYGDDWCGDDWCGDDWHSGNAYGAADAADASADACSGDARGGASGDAGIDDGANSSDGACGREGGVDGRGA
jgi:hypothetical protein